MKYLTPLVVLVSFALLVAPALAADATVPITPDPIGPGNSAPDVYLSARYFDLGIDIDGSGSSINPSDIRPSFYAFTGERIIYYVLVRDQNGAEDINLVYWVRGTSTEEGPCDVVTVSGSESTAYYLNDDREPVEIDESTNLQYDDQTDKVYRCELTVESGWTGTAIFVKARDSSSPAATGQTLSENWNFNPALSVGIPTSDDDPLSFGNRLADQDVQGATSPNCVMVPNGGKEDLTKRDCPDYISDNEPEKKCDISLSENTIIITNTGVPSLWPFIAASNFYATSGMSKCPSTNELSANQFEYRAIQGTFDSGWRIMPQYSPNLGCAGLDLGSSSPSDRINGQCRGGCRIPTGTTGSDLGLPGLDALSTGQNINVRFKIVWPTPCIGTFNQGTFYTIVRAV